MNYLSILENIYSADMYASWYSLPENLSRYLWAHCSRVSKAVHACYGLTHYRSVSHHPFLCPPFLRHVANMERLGASCLTTEMPVFTQERSSHSALYSQVAQFVTFFFSEAFIMIIIYTNRPETEIESKVDLILGTGSTGIPRPMNGKSSPLLQSWPNLFLRQRRHSWAVVVHIFPISNGGR